MQSFVIALLSGASLLGLSTDNPGSEDLLAADTRLAKKVTYCDNRVYVGELLAKLKAAIGVDLSADTNDGAADYRVFVHVRDVRLIDCMDSIRSLFSYKRAEWEWERTGQAGGYRYRLRRTGAAQRLAARLQMLVQEEFEKQASTLLRAGGMSDKERRTFLQGMLDELYGGDESLLQADLRIERKWNGLKLFASVLNKQQQTDLVRSPGAHVRIPAGELSAFGQDFLKVQLEAAGPFARIRAADGSLVPLPEPKWIDFQASRRANSFLAPILVITLDGLGGYGYVGGTPLERALRKSLAELWQLPGDKRDDPLSQTVVDGGNSAEITRNRVLEGRLAQLGDSAHVPVIARLPMIQDEDAGSPTGKSVGAWLVGCAEKSPHLQSKWRSGTLLVTYPTWFWDEDDMVPMSIFTRLRDASERAQGIIPLAVLLDVASVLTRGQVAAVAEDFQPMRHLGVWYEVIAIANENSDSRRRVLTKAGLPLTDLMRQRLSSISYLRTALESNDATSLRLEEELLSVDGHRESETTIGLVTRDKRWIPVIGFRQKPPKPKAP